jgi:hypothetical protein
MLWCYMTWQMMQKPHVRSFLTTLTSNTKIKILNKHRLSKFDANKNYNWIWGGLNMYILKE